MKIFPGLNSQDAAVMSASLKFYSNYEMPSTELIMTQIG